MEEVTINKDHYVFLLVHALSFYEMAMCNAKEEKDKLMYTKTVQELRIELNNVEI